jgi:magnesium transporter
VLSHQLNESFRVLTAASVVLLPLTLIASIFGMNVQFPGEGETLTFYLILVLMTVVLVGLVILFRRRGWL